MASIVDLPPEILGMIGELLDDRSLARLSQACSVISNALSGEALLWRHLFTRSYDETPELTTIEMSRRYRAFRRHLRLGMRRGDKIHLGEAPGERRLVSVLKLMIREAFSDTGEESRRRHSQNLAYLSDYCRRSCLYLDFCRSDKALDAVDGDLLMVQVMLAHELFNKSANEQDYGLAESQSVVYASARNEPVIGGSAKITVNFKFLRSVINVLYCALIYSELRLQLFQEEDLATSLARVPRPWNERLVPGVTKIGKNWVGLHAAAETVPKLLAIRQNPDWQADFDAMDVIAPAFDGLQFAYIENAPVNFPLRDEIERHLKCSEHPTQDYWEVLAEKDLVRGPLTQEDRKRMHARLLEADHLHQSVIRVPEWFHKFTVDLTLEGRVNQDDREDVEWAPIMFKCATGRPNPGNRQDPVLEQRIGVGFLQPVPVQRGIPGWMRFSMLTFSCPTFGEPRADQSFRKLMSPTDHRLFWQMLESDVASVADEESPTGRRLVDDAFGYEGIVLPGGQMSLGRWWQVDPSNPDSMMAAECVQPSGPFMFWRIHDDDVSVPTLMPAGFGPPPPWTV